MAPNRRWSRFRAELFAWITAPIWFPLALILFALGVLSSCASINGGAFIGGQACGGTYTETRPDGTKIVHSGACR